MNNKFSAKAISIKGYTTNSCMLLLSNYGRVEQISSLQFLTADTFRRYQSHN
jgi:hypothetical protein